MLNSLVTKIELNNFYSIDLVTLDFVNKYIYHHYYSCTQKMSRNDKSSVSQLQNDQHKKILTSLLREEGNRRCADCFSRGPTWASVNLGVFVCLNCSGEERNVSMPRSLTPFSFKLHYLTLNNTDFVQAFIAAWVYTSPKSAPPIW